MKSVSAPPAISENEQNGFRDQSPYESDALHGRAAPFLRAILQNMPESIYFKDLESRFLCASRSLAVKCGVDPEELIGLTDFDIFSHEHAQQAFDDEQEIIRTGQPILDAEEKETWADGSVTWVATTKMPLYSDENVIVGTFGVSRDITKRKRAENDLKATQTELLEASRLAGMAEISTGILHNIGNALNSVNTSTSLIQSKLERSRLANLPKVASMLNDHKGDLAAFLTTDERGTRLPSYLVHLSAELEKERQNFREEIQQIRQSVEHINSVVAMQQMYSRARDNPESTDPAELVNEALQISEISLSRHGVNVVRDFAPVSDVHVTRHQVLVILINFIRNAKYALDDSGREEKVITTLLREHDKQVHITVRDNGVGIDPKDRERIFNFGFTTRENGHGFGLHSSANTARELEASISFESEGLGKGAAFTLSLPLTQPSKNAGDP